MMTISKKTITLLSRIMGKIAPILRLKYSIRVDCPKSKEI